MLRRVPFEKIENFRDLGGYQSFYGETQFGVVYRSGTLCDATSHDLETLQKIGIRSIIDLRDDEAKKETPDRTAALSAITTYLLPVNGNGRIPKNRNDQVDSYLEMLEDSQKAKAVFMTLATCPKPCVIHCNAGKDRTGMFVASLLLANGVPFHDVNADYMLSFPYLTRLTAKTKKEYPAFPKALLTPSATFLKRVFNRFRAKWGTINDYFASIGISSDDIRLLDNLLGKQEKSCGAVVFYQGKVLVEHMIQGHYSLTKGHVESFDKDEKATAIREIREETGIEATINSSEQYSIVYSPYPGIAKRVVFFLGSSTTDKTKSQPEEVENILWLSPREALTILTHDTDKEVLRWAVAKLGLSL